MKATIVFTALIILAPVSAQPATWYVELDGSGDFLDIQPAVDAAAAGWLAVLPSPAARVDGR